MSINAYNDMEFRRHWLFSKIIETANYFRDEALQWAFNDEDRAFINNYKFTFSYLADWSMPFVPRLGCMAAVDLLGARNANNRFVRERVRTLYVNHNIILVCLNHNETGNFIPTTHGVYLVVAP